jgi:hypothetical protein
MINSSGLGRFSFSTVDTMWWHSHLVCEGGGGAQHGVDAQPAWLRALVVVEFHHARTPLRAARAAQVVAKPAREMLPVRASVCVRLVRDTAYSLCRCDAGLARPATGKGRSPAQLLHEHAPQRVQRRALHTHIVFSVLVHTTGPF